MEIMAQTIRVRGEYGLYYYIDSSSSRDVLTSAQMTANAVYIFSWCKDKQPSWTTVAIAAMCGNFQHEGILNPAQWQYGLNKNPDSGYGLAQWTPSTKFIEWARGLGYDIKSIDAEMQRIQYERANKIQYYPTTKYPISFDEFLTGTYDVATLAKAWLYNYERPKYPQQTESIRVSSAQRWLKVFGGVEPTPPEPEPPDPEQPTLLGQRGMPLYMYPGWRKQ